MNQLDDDEDDDEDEEEMKEAAPLRKKTEREIELELGDDYILGEFRLQQPREVIATLVTLGHSREY